MNQELKEILDCNGEIVIINAVEKVCHQIDLNFNKISDKLVEQGYNDKVLTKAYLKIESGEYNATYYSNGTYDELRILIVGLPPLIIR